VGYREGTKLSTSQLRIGENSLRQLRRDRKEKMQGEFLRPRGEL